MNTRRQTVWLVSMLSLMVVLSAYYLFTDKVGEADIAVDEATTIEAVELGEHTEGMELGERLGEQLAAEMNGGGEAEPQTITTSARGSREYFAILELERNDALSRHTEQLMSIAIDPDKSAEEVGKAEEELRTIQDMQARVSDLEYQLMQQYENVIIAEEEGRWKVIVQANALNRSEAVSIIDKVAADLNMQPGKLAVQYIP